MSLLRDIQDEAASPQSDVTSLLRKCKILAARLGSPDFASWVDWELNGYPEAQPTPSYRSLRTNLYANFMNVAWRADKQAVPIAIVPENMRSKVQEINFREGIAKVTSFTKKGCAINTPELAFVLEGKMFPDMQCVSAWIEISSGEFEQLTSAIKNRILDFVLKIEAENPAAGEAPLNSEPIAKEKVRTLVNNNFFGTVGNLAQNSHHFAQDVRMEIGIQDLTRLISELGVHLHELKLTAAENRRATAQLSTLEAQLADDPDPVIVRQALRTLRSVTEGAIGSLLGAATQPAVWQWVHQFMMRVS